MSKLTYEYLAANISFVNVYKKDLTKLTNWFKKEEEKATEYPWFTLPITEDEYNLFLRGEIFDSKESLFEAIDQACYPTYKLDDKDKREVIAYRKCLVGIMGNIENMFTKDEVFGKSYTVYTHDRLWNGPQDNDYIVIHYKDGIWFVNKIDSEDIAFMESE